MTRPWAVFPALLLLILLMVLLLLPPLATAQQSTDFYEQMPPALRVRQSLHITRPGKNVSIRRTVPQSCNPQVDAQISALVDELSARIEPFLPARSNVVARADTGSVIYRTGTSFMSFLTIAQCDLGREPVAIAYDTRVYDMATGERIALTDVFPPQSEAWALLSRGVREQLSAAFPGETPDERKLDALCEEQALRSAHFTLGASRLMLTYHAGELYPGKQMLLHAVFYYSEIRPFMSERAQAQTDNSRYRMVALTFDDGGALGLTRAVLDSLRETGAGATFFVIGRQIAKSHDNLVRQKSAGYSVASHTYDHLYGFETSKEEIVSDRDRMNEAFVQAVGALPTLLRAPGGAEEAYIACKYGLPMIHWSLAAGDSDNSDAAGIERHVIYSAGDGDIILLHETNERAGRYTKRIAEKLSDMGFLMVTVEELFDDARVPLEADRIYFSTTDIRDER